MTLRLATPVGLTKVVAARAPESPDWDGSCAPASNPKAVTRLTPAMMATRNPLSTYRKDSRRNARFLALKERFGIDSWFIGNSMFRVVGD
jgi:hypothetical protein